ncbi:WD repeat-containing protein 87-like [Papaver somniferum]|uniref:WD repeat-containing protein 87-like n=1 Tax=Papaver somniferum TaxID=3469 RepID=UPI000E6FFBA4|nr:WD repeat-containing protein 87-like [Papaver somniferum]
MARGKAPRKKQLATRAAPATGGVKKPAARMCKNKQPAAKINSHSKINFIKHFESQLKGTPYLKVLEDSCFGHLIHLPEINLYANVIYNVLLKRKYPSKKDKEEKDGMPFNIGNQEICFSKREFAMMSGLKFQGSEKIDYNPEKIRLMKVHFPGQHSVKLEELIKKFNQLKNSKDKVKLGLLYIAEAVIMGHRPKWNINKGLFFLVDNIEEFNRYPWGKLSYKETIKSLICLSEKKNVSKSKHLVGKVSHHLYGFPLVFQAWIFHSIPELQQVYTEKNEDCPQGIHPGILHLKKANRAPWHKTSLIELSNVKKVLSPLHPTLDELKEGYMAGFPSDEEVSGAKGPQNDSGIQALIGEDYATEQWEDDSSPNNSLKVDNQNGRTIKEVITLSGGEDQDVESLENLKLKLGSEIEVLNKEKSAVESDVGLLNEKRNELETDRYKLLAEMAILNKEKLKLGRDIESLNMEKTRLGTDADLLSKEKENLQSDFDILNQEKTAVESDLRLHFEQQKKLQCDIENLYKEKTKLVSDTELLNKEKSIVESDIELLYKKKTTLGNDIKLLSLEKSELETGYEFLKDEKNKLATDLEFTNKEKDKLQNDVELLNEEKDKLQSDVEFLNEEKAKLGSHAELLSKEKTKLQSDFECLNRDKSTVLVDICSLNEKKSVVQNDICSLNGKKITVQDDICSLNEKKATVHGDICSLNEKKTFLESEIESLNNEKTNLGNETDLLGKEKMKLQTDIEFHNKEKAEFIRSVTADLNKSFYEREKALSENEKIFVELKEMNRTLVAKERCYAEELQEARQVLIKQMESEKSTKSRVIGVKRMRGDQVLWNFKEKKRATLKDVISFRLNRTDK